MTVPQQRRATTASMASPIGGWNARDSLANMQPLDAVQLINFFPIEYNFNKEEKIQKYCKIISDINPFDSKKTVYYYMLKNKISF